ncbi:MAG: hypothetical protein LBS31_02795 [Candidatus Adiutrix sp.]|jgi:predicted DNA-binding protein (UPF0251 family)|nr:hypothetical protein [Candidatus Adiutrix sp.]
MRPLTRYILMMTPVGVSVDAPAESLVPDDMRVFIVPEPKDKDELTMAAALAELAAWLRLDPEARRKALLPDLPEPFDLGEAAAGLDEDAPALPPPGTRLNKPAPDPAPGSLAEELEAMRPRAIHRIGRLTRDDWERKLQAVDKIIDALREGDETAPPPSCPAPVPPRPASLAAKIEALQPRARRGRAARRQLTYTDWEKMRAAFERGVSVQDLARTMSVSRPTIYSWLSFTPERARRHFHA